uniref:Acid phosphatase n=1 Tax=Ditylenchus dipsaci TaxID=166011 RepID=A0A915EF24_9BILA
MVMLVYSGQPSVFCLCACMIFQSIKVIVSSRRNVSLTPAGRTAYIGGLPIYPYYSYAQNQVAKAMVKVADREKSLDFVINLGDNLYFNGADTVFDSRFENSFEEVYDQPQLSVPWFTIGAANGLFPSFSTKCATLWSSR